ncbi:MAG: hypothetical protein N2171_07035 [Clostridia bacterium]|nr:hypothetical protein [Clostridia bacterium]
MTLKVFGGICVALFTVAMIFSSTPIVNTVNTAKRTLPIMYLHHYLQTILLAKDENMGQEDYSTTHKYD